MQLPGYWVSLYDTDVTIDKATLDKNELTAESNWKKAWQNLDSDAGHINIRKNNFDIS